MKTHEEIRAAADRAWATYSNDLGDDYTAFIDAVTSEFQSLMAALPAPEPKFEWQDHAGGFFSTCWVGNWLLTAIGMEWSAGLGAAALYGGKGEMNPKAAAEAWARENLLVHKF